MDKVQDPTCPRPTPPPKLNSPTAGMSTTKGIEVDEWDALTLELERKIEQQRNDIASFANPIDSYSTGSHNLLDNDDMEWLK